MENPERGRLSLASLSQGNHWVTCKTCKTSKTYLTPEGVSAFKLDHMRHEVIDERIFDFDGGRPAQPRNQPSEAQDDSRPSKILPQVLEPVEEGPDGRFRQNPLVLTEKDLSEPLLLARSSYIDEDHVDKREALKVSRALKEFRWNVEPPYVIGIMADDNLSIETNTSVISRGLIRRIEELGYTFAAVSAPQGSPVAWFKRGIGADLEVMAGVARRPS